MDNQKMFDSMLYGIKRNNKKEGYKELLEFYSSLPIEEREKIDVSSVHENLLDDIANYEGDLEVIYGFGNYDDEFKKEAEERVKSCGQTALICQYLEFNDLATEEFVSLGVSAIASVMPDCEIELEALARLKEQVIQKGLYDDMIYGIKTSGDIDTVVCAALCFESALIDDVFGGKPQMFMYLTAGEFTDEECLDMYMERLLTMDSCQLQNDIKSDVKNIDAKIKEKKL